MASNPSPRKSSPSSPPSSRSGSARPSHDDISQRARELWESRGCPAGQDESIWLEAESQLSPASRSNGMLQATGRMERSDTDPFKDEGGAEASARGNQERETDDDPDI